MEAATHLNGALLLIGGLVAVVGVVGCDGADDGTTDNAGCLTIAEQCGGATGCFALCSCAGSDEASCRVQCDLSVDSPLVRALPPWPDDADERSLLTLINDQRARGGCCAPDSCFERSAALTVDDMLTKAARRHAVDMADRNFFSHDTPEGDTAADRIRGAGFRGCAIGENLAASYATATEVLSAWLASRDHCENMFWPRFGVAGIARYESAPDALGTVWVADFGGP